MAVAVETNRKIYAEGVHMALQLMRMQNGHSRSRQAQIVETGIEAYKHDTKKNDLPKINPEHWREIPQEQWRKIAIELQTAMIVGFVPTVQPAIRAKAGLVLELLVYIGESCVNQKVDALIAARGKMDAYVNQTHGDEEFMSWYGGYPQIHSESGYRFDLNLAIKNENIVEGNEVLRRVASRQQDRVVKYLSGDSLNTSA